MQNLRGQWITQPPTRCPNGHPLGPNQVLVGPSSLPRPRRRAHHMDCRTCDETVYGPPLNTHSSALDGPATVRISTASLANV